MAGEVLGFPVASRVASNLGHRALSHPHRVYVTLKYFGKAEESYASSFAVTSFSHGELERKGMSPWPVISADITFGAMPRDELLLLTECVVDIDRRLRNVCSKAVSFAVLGYVYGFEGSNRRMGKMTPHKPAGQGMRNYDPVFFEPIFSYINPNLTNEPRLLHGVLATVYAEETDPTFMLRKAKSSRSRPRSSTWSMSGGGSEPLLWVPDQILGAYGEVITKGANRRWERTWNMLSECIDVREVTVR